MWLYHRAHFFKEMKFLHLGLIWIFPLCQQKVEIFQNVAESSTQRCVPISTHANFS